MCLSILVCITRICFDCNAKVLSLQSRDVSERLVQLQRCMNSLQEPGVPRGRVGQGGDTLGAILALMAAVLTECDLHCHSQALRAMARRLGEEHGQHTHTLVMCSFANDSFF